MTTSPRSALERLTRWRAGEHYARAEDLSDDVAALLSLLEWRPISEAPKDGQFLAACFAPTNWEFHVKHVRVYADPGMARRNEMQLRYCTHWMPLPAAPTEDKP
ncbi:MAG: hypothetical protein ACLGJC_09590 [Alphaproteobacteria bacterium]